MIKSLTPLAVFTFAGLIIKCTMFWILRVYRKEHGTLSTSQNAWHDFDENHFSDRKQSAKKRH